LISCNHPKVLIFIVPLAYVLYCPVMRMAPGRAAPCSVQHLADYYNSVYLQERLQQNLVRLKQGYSSSTREDLCSTGSVRCAAV
jgi:hypothetical protein